MLESRRIPAPQAIFLQRHAGGVLARFAYRMGDQALGGNGNPVGQLEMAEHARIAADLAVAADPGTAGHGGASGHCGVRAHVHVVGDLDLVVQPHVFFQHGVVQRAAVNRGVGADLAVIADAYPTQLGQLDPVVGVEGQAEAVRTDHRAGMHQHAATQDDARDQGDPGHQPRLRTHRAALADDAVWPQHGAVLDHCIGLDHAARADAGAGADARGSGDHGTGMHASRCGGQALEQRGDARVGDVGVPGDQRGGRAIGEVLLAQHHHARAGGQQLRGIFAVGKKAQLAGAGATERAHAAHHPRAVAADVEAEARGQFGCRVVDGVHAWLRTVRVIVGRGTARRRCARATKKKTRHRRVFLRDAGSSARGGARTGRWSELAAEGELDALLVMTVRRLRAERHGQADDQRADRRLPMQRYAGRGAQRAGVEALVIPVDVADVGEQRHARGVDVLQERQRQVQLGGAQHLERAADRLRPVGAQAVAARVRRAAVDAHARAQGVVLEAAYVAHAAGREVGEEREILAQVGHHVACAALRLGGGLEHGELVVADAVLAIGLAVAHLAVQVEHEAFADRPVMVGLGGELPVLHGGAGQGDIRLGLQQAAAGGRPEAVAGVVVPAQRAGPRMDRLVAELVLVVDQVPRAVAGEQVDLVAADAQAHAHAVGFADRDAQVGGEALGAGAVVGVVGVAVVGLGIVDAVADADAVVGQVRVVVVGAETGLVGAARAAHREAVATAEQVVLAQRGVEDDAGVLRVADAELHAAGGLLLDLDADVDLVLRAGHQFLVDVDLLEVAQPLQADLRAVDRGLRVHGAFELAHLATQHVVLGLGVAGEDHAAHVHALARLDVHGQVDRVLVLVQLRDRGDLGVGIADVGQHRLDRLAGVLDRAAVEDVAFLDEHQLAHRRFRQDQVAEQLDVGDLVDVAFLDAGVGVQVALVRRDADLGRIHAEIRVTTVHVVGLQLLQVAGKLLALVLVVLGLPRHQVRRAGLEIVADLLVGVGVVAEDVDLADLGGLALADLDVDGDTVAVEPGHVRLDRHVVLAAVVVLPDQLLLHAVDGQPVEGLAFGDAGLLEALLQVVGLDVVVAADVELGRSEEHT